MGTTARFYDAVVGKVARVVVVNPHQFQVISASVSKTDRKDAAALALYLSKGLLPEARMKPKRHREVAHLTETRDLLVKQRSALKNKINNLLAMQGVNLKREALSSKVALERVLALEVSALMKIELRVLVEQVRSLGGSIGELEELIEEAGEELPGYKNLTSIKGIGSLSATVLLTTIGAVNDFADEDKLAAYVGLVPRGQNSNETERSGRITKKGNKLARTALVQCGLVAKRYSPYLNQFYNRIKERRGHGKAKIALARKMVKIVYDTLKNNWVFEDFPSFTMAAQPSPTIIE